MDTSASVDNLRSPSWGHSGWKRQACKKTGPLARADRQDGKEGTKAASPGTRPCQVGCLSREALQRVAGGVGAAPLQRVSRMSGDSSRPHFSALGSVPRGMAHLDFNPKIHSMGIMAVDTV